MGEACSAASEALLSSHLRHGNLKMPSSLLKLVKQQTTGYAPKKVSQYNHTVTQKDN
jgi:hypothetical protein